MTARFHPRSLLLRHCDQPEQQRRGGSPGATKQRSQLSADFSTAQIEMPHVSASVRALCAQDRVGRRLRLIVGEAAQQRPGERRRLLVRRRSRTRGRVADDASGPAFAGAGQACGVVGLAQRTQNRDRSLGRSRTNPRAGSADPCHITASFGVMAGRPTTSEQDDRSVHHALRGGFQ